ncbi:MAG: hypothetical protein ACRC46_03695 [Thermoguttaceae bacterium]
MTLLDNDKTSSMQPVTPSRTVQRRSVLAVVSGLALMGVCLCFTAATVAGLFDPVEGVIFAILLTPIALPLAWMAFKQYLALFCCPPAVARAYYEAYFALGGLLTFGAVAGLFEDRRILKDKDALMFLGGMLAVGLALLAIAQLNRLSTLKRRRIALESKEIDESDLILKPVFKTEYRLRALVGILSILVVVACMSVLFVYDVKQHPAFGEHLTYEQFPYNNRFPASGSDFSFWRGYRGTMVCEFTISEEGFRDWIASQSRWEYCRPIEDNDQFSISIPKYGTYNGDFADGKEPRPIPSEGLYAGYGTGKGGRAVFDRKTNRAYYWTYY